MALAHQLDVGGTDKTTLDFGQAACDAAKAGQLAKYAEISASVYSDNPEGRKTLSKMMSAAAVKLCPDQALKLSEAANQLSPS